MFLLILFLNYRLNRTGAQYLFFAALHQRCTALHKLCLSTVWPRVAILLHLYCSAPAVTKMQCCSERKTAFVQPFCSAPCSANKSLKQRCFNVFCIVRAEVPKQEGHITDPSGHIKIILWGRHADTLQEGYTYFFNKVRIKVNQGQKYLIQQARFTSTCLASKL